MSDYERDCSEDEWRADVAHLSTNALMRKYPLTNSSFQGMKKRVREGRATCDHRVANFKGFLLAFGPRREKHLTLDRIDNSDTEYAEEKCEWKTPAAQARNRSSSRTIFDPDSGSQIFLLDIAKEQNISPRTVRRRADDGWALQELQQGRRTRNNQTGSWPFSIPTDKIPLPVYPFDACVTRQV